MTGATTLEQNKAVVREFFARFSASDIPGALATLTDDATWWIAGKPGAFPVTGTQTKEQIARVFRSMVKQTTNGLQLTVKGIVAEGDTVAAEVVSHAELKNGRVYDQEYHVLMLIRDGKISAVREYLDTQHVFATWFAP